MQPTFTIDALMMTISNGLIDLPFSFCNLGLGYKGTDFPGFNVFHTRHLPTSKYKLIFLSLAQRIEHF